MAASRITYETVRKIALELPGVEESTSYGQASLKVNGKILTCMAMNKSVEPGTLVIRVSFEQRDELMSTAPDIYYITDHYVPYPSVLVRLPKIHPDALKDLVLMGWRFVTSAKKVRTKRPPARERMR